METTFTVRGMTCDHCVLAVTGELNAIPGVEGVTVELASGQVHVRSESPLPDDSVRQAIDDAGYELDR